MIQKDAALHCWAKQSSYSRSSSHVVTTRHANEAVLVSCGNDCYPTCQVGPVFCRPLPCFLEDHMCKSFQASFISRNELLHCHDGVMLHSRMYADACLEFLWGFVKREA
jgi:hypothetical protein